jgi:hypothetical protein
MSGFRFVQFYPDGQPPVRGDRGLYGSSPLRGFQFCEPYCAANELGWHAFLPIDFALKWDGTEISWYVVDCGGWMPLRSAVLPGFAEQWSRLGRSSCERGPPPFLSSLPEPGLVQIWTGLAGRSPEGWALLVRPPPNLPRGLGFEVLEGIIETDWWFGPIITTIRICRTDEPVLFRRSLPILALQPIPKTILDPSFYASASLESGAEMLSESDWDDFQSAMALHGRDGRPGGYKAALRTQRKT